MPLERLFDVNGTYAIMFVDVCENKTNFLKVIKRSLNKKKQCAHLFRL